MSDTKTIILAPGQGAQHVGMGKAWAAASPAAKALFDAADAALDMPLAQICFEGPEDQVTRTDIAQAAIYVTTLACCAALEERGELDRSALAATAGLSLGEYTALHLAGAFGFEDGLSLVAQRGRFMQEAAEASDSTMVALTGEVDEAKALAICDAARQGDEVLVPANYNSPMQVVVSGSTAACARVPDIAQAQGLRATPLTVAGAFHSPLMQSAAERMGEALAGVDFAAPRVPVLSNVTGEPHGDDVDAIKRLLVEQITSPVRWTQNMQWLVAHASGRYIEPAPGKVLTGLMRRIDRQTKVESFAEPA